MIALPFLRSEKLFNIYEEGMVCAMQMMLLSHLFVSLILLFKFNCFYHIVFFLYSVPQNSFFLDRWRFISLWIYYNYYYFYY